MRKVAFVGAEEATWVREGFPLDVVEERVRYIMSRYWDDSGPYIFVSGACPKGGVDIWAEKYAYEKGMQKEIYSPDVPRWTGDAHRWGYKERNIIIAAVSDIVVCIDPKGVYSGGNWTRLAAKKLGKATDRVGLSLDPRLQTRLRLGL